MQDMLSDVLPQNYGMWVRAVDTLHRSVPDVLSIANELDPRQPMGYVLWFVRESRDYVENVFGSLSTRERCLLSDLTDRLLAAVSTK